jgi:hypothetical protein
MTDTIHTSSPTIKSRDSASTEFARDVFAWFKQIHADQAIIPNAKPISALDFRLAYAITQYIDKFSRKAWPFQETLAADLGVTDRTVRNGIANLVKRGHLTVTMRGRDQSAIYQMILQDRKSTSGHDEARPETDFRSKPQDRKSGAARPEKSRRKTGSTLPTEPLFEPLREPLREEDSPQPQFDLEEDGRREVVPSSPPDTTDADFEEFYSAYPKKKARDDALKAYRSALKRGATPEQLLAGALRASEEYHRDVERRGKDTAYQFVAFPAAWLNKGRWADEPAPAGDGGYRPPPGQPDHIAVGIELARQAMAKNGGGQNVH